MTAAKAAARRRRRKPAAAATASSPSSPSPSPLTIPATKDALVAVGDREVQLTNLDKPFWPELGISKRDLLQYYADVAPVLLPHLATARW